MKRIFVSEIKTEKHMQVLSLHVTTEAVYVPGLRYPMTLSWVSYSFSENSWGSWLFRGVDMHISGYRQAWNTCSSLFRYARTFLETNANAAPSDVVDEIGENERIFDYRDGMLKKISDIGNVNEVRWVALSRDGDRLSYCLATSPEDAEKKMMISLVNEKAKFFDWASNAFKVSISNAFDKPEMWYYTFEEKANL